MMQPSAKHYKSPSPWSCHSGDKRIKFNINKKCRVCWMVICIWGEIMPENDQVTCRGTIPNICEYELWCLDLMLVREQIVSLKEISWEDREHCLSSEAEASWCMMETRCRCDSPGAWEGRSLEGGADSMVCSLETKKDGGATSWGSMSYTPSCVMSSIV